MEPPRGRPRKTRGTALASRLLALIAVACAHSGPALELPRLDDASGIDKLVLDRVDQALTAFERGDPAAALELGLVYEANELDVLALRTYDLCLELALPLAEVHFHRGRTLAAMGRSDEASVAFAAALTHAPDYVPALWRNGSVLLEAGRVAEARAQFEHAMELEPANVATRLGLARLQLVEDDPAGAIRTLTPVIERQPNERFAHGLLSRAYRALAESERAEAELALESSATHVSMADPLTAEMRKRATGIVPAVRKANDALASGKREEALKILEPVYARDPEKLAIVQMMAKTLLENGQVERALEVLEAGAKLHPDDYKLELLRGIARLEQDQLEPARAHLERARALNPSYGPTHGSLGEVLSRLGRREEAEQALSVAIAATEAELRTFLTLGQLQLKQSAFERAIETFTRACERFPQAAGAWVHLAEAQALGGAREAARLSLAAAEALNSTHPRLVNVRRLVAESAAR
mgnify:CR=1 FL=1